MNVLPNILNYLKGSFKLPEEPKLTTIEETALKNIISVAKERIWLHDPINCHEYDSDKFEEELTLDSVDNIKKSVIIAETLLSKYKIVEND